MTGPDRDRVPVDPATYEPPPLDQVARRFGVPWEWYDAIGIYVIWILLAGPVVLAVTALVGGETSDLATASQILVTLVVLVVVTVVWVRLRASAADVADGLRRALGPKRPVAADIRRGVILGVGAFLAVQLGLGLLISSLVEALGQELPEIQEEVQTAVQGEGSVPLLVAFAVAILAPVGEELLFRGVLYQALAKRLHGWPALGLSGLAFGLTHVEPFVIVLTFPLGMVLAWALRRHGTLVVPVVAHAVFNLIGVVLIRLGG
ncbi:lysostaphin resistance A-like protein [Euzebya sp.]|uniref:CPBP family intramembrane glutamic endopeptidase n=1 Tax=Euzebya sp. TaxID=1971409 RepID=UPI0035137778